MNTLDLRPSSECKWDLVSFGEIMLRLDPGEGRVRTTRSFNAWEGGGTGLAEPNCDVAIQIHCGRRHPAVVVVR